MNTIEKALMHALFFHLHHNIDKTIAVIPNRPSEADLDELTREA